MQVEISKETLDRLRDFKDIISSYPWEYSMDDLVKRLLLLAGF